jgi:predicted amidophosphoribosyltransferase
MSKETYLYRVAQSRFYERNAYIFALDHYVPQSEGVDEFSKKQVHFYKYGNEDQQEFFMENFIRLFRMRFQRDDREYDYLTLYPTHEEGGLNENMQTLVEGVAAATGIEYNQILRRNETIAPSHELESVEERKENVQGSVNITEDVSGDTIIVVDNVSISGLSLIDVTNHLYEKGAETVVCACLGISEVGKDGDYDDLNHTMGAERIMDIFQTPLIPENERKSQN